LLWRPKWCIFNGTSMRILNTGMRVSTITEGNLPETLQGVVLVTDAVQPQSPRSGSSIGDLAYAILKDRREPMKYKDLVNEVLARRNLKPGESLARLMAKAHTEISLDTRFLNRGSGLCGLREWTVKPPSYKVVEVSPADRLKPGERLRRELVVIDEDYQEEATEEEPVGEPEEPEMG
jgi:DNA-directed RNA polymerase delta subunit